MDGSSDNATGLAEVVYAAKNTFNPLRTFLLATCVFGIAFNLMVFCKRKRSSKRQASTTKISLRLLAIMAIADTISLCALLLMLSMNHVGRRESQFIMNLVCKVDLFLIHAASAFSIWCWLIMSAVRYIAIYRPYTHLKLNKEPMIAVAFMAIMCCVFESWILVFVEFRSEAGGCVDDMPVAYQYGTQMAEITWSYFLPVVLITVLDFKVICCHSVWSSHGPPSVKNSEGQMTHSTPSTAIRSSVVNADETAPALDNKDELNASKESLNKTNFSPSPSFDKSGSPVHVAVVTPTPSRDTRSSSTKPKRYSRRAQQMRILKRCLAISVLDLGMNLPNYLIRLYLVMGGDAIIDSPWFEMLQEVSQMLYFAQFALNAVYLMGIIYVSPKRRPKYSATFQSGAQRSSVWQ